MPISETDVAMQEYLGVPTSTAIPLKHSYSV